jgi:hypothetical protein
MRRRRIETIDFIGWLPLVDAFRTFCRLPGVEGKILFAEIASFPALAA